jgi:hypothetical protein
VLAETAALAAAFVVGAFCLPFVLVLVRALARFVVRPGSSLEHLAQRYPRASSALPRLALFQSANLPALSDLALGVGFGLEGMTVTYHGLFRSVPDILIPWQHLSIDLDLGFLVVVEVVPEGTQFLLGLGAITRADVRRIRAREGS